jgi:hypothetical protein
MREIFDLSLGIPRRTPGQGGVGPTYCQNLPTPRGPKVLSAKDNSVPISSRQCLLCIVPGIASDALKLT